MFYVILSGVIRISKTPPKGNMLQSQDLDMWKWIFWFDIVAVFIAMMRWQSGVNPSSKLGDLSLSELLAF